MAKHNKDWNNTSTNPYAEPEVKAEEFEKQWEQNKAAGDEKAKQDPYRRPQPSSHRKP